MAEAKREQRGIVLKKMLGRYVVRSSEETVVCTITSLLRRTLLYPTADPASLRPVVVGIQDIRTVDPVAVGDHVTFVDADEGTGQITDVMPRRTKLSRVAAGSKPLEQVVVANVDQVVPVFSARQPKPKWHLLDRYLGSAEAEGLPSVICITKMDLAREGELDEYAAIYREAGYRVLLTSVFDERGVEELKDALNEKSSVFVGKSGVGKTSLLNAVQPELGLRVQGVSRKTSKGKHTTTNLEMFELDGGGRIVDTPGMREFGLWNVKGSDAKIDRLFPEMRPHLEMCRFGTDCSHTHEPDCAVKLAVEQGDVSEPRYDSYKKLVAR